jgi:hypothetical protein
MRARLSLLPALFFLHGIPVSASAQAGGSVAFVGTEVLPLGGATLSVGPTLAGGVTPSAINRLYVGNLSFSGSDGFSMQVGGGSGALIGFMDTAPTFPVGGEIEFRASNDVGIQPCVRIAKSGASMIMIDPDFTPLGATSYRVEVWSGGEPVATSDDVRDHVAVAIFPIMLAVDVESIMAPLPVSSLPATSAFALSDGFLLRWSADVTLLDATGSPLGTGDELRMYAEGTIPLGFVATIDVTVTVPIVFAPYTMVVDDLAQQQFGRLHRGGGSATILCHTAGAPTRRSDAYVLTHRRGVSAMVPMGTAGSLQADVHPAQSGDDLIWDLKDGFVTGDMDGYSVTAELLTGGQAVVGKVTSLHTGSHWNVTPDFAGSGSPDARVELFDASGNLVGSNPCITEFSVMTDAWAIETGFEDGDDLALELAFATPVPVDIGTGPITASRIKMHSNASKKHRFFAIVDRSFSRPFVVGGDDFFASGERPTLELAQDPGIVEYVSIGSAYAKKGYDSLLLNGMGGTGSDGVELEPCILPGETPPDQFGVEWMPLGPPSANMGETDWAFASRLAGDAAPVERMSIRMASNGSVVGVMAPSKPTQPPYFRVVLKNSRVTAAEFIHTDLATAFAELPDWPIAVGYQLLAYDDQPWSMWINLGYVMDVTIPGLAASGGGAVIPSVRADMIEVIAQNTANPGPVQAATLGGRFTSIPLIVLRDSRPQPTPVGPTTRLGRSVLRPAYPNPFNPRTTLSFDLATSGQVSLKIYAVDGSYVATLHTGVLTAGPHEYAWNGVDHRGQTAASGVYFAELRTPDENLRTKLNLLK